MKKTDLKVNNTLTEKSTAPEDIVEIEKLLQSGKIVVSGYIPDEFQIKKLIYSSDLKTLIKECKSAHFNKVLNKFDITFISGEKRFYAAGEIL